jgi:hypothetical protein
MKDSTEAVVLVAVAGIAIYAIYQGVGKAGSAAAGAAAQGGSNLYDALGLTSLDNWINSTFGLPGNEVVGQSSYTAPAASTLQGLGSLAVTMPNGATVAVPEASVNSAGRFAYRGTAYQGYVDKQSNVHAREIPT